MCLVSWREIKYVFLADRCFLSNVHDITGSRLLGITTNHSKISYKTMKVMDTVNDESIWSYELIDGKCDNSMSLYTAKQFNIPAHIIKRAEYFHSVYDKQHKPSILHISCTDDHKNSTDLLTAVNKEYNTLNDFTHEIKQIISSGNILPVGTSVTENYDNRVHLTIVEKEEITPIFLESQYCVYILELRQQPSVSLLLYTYQYCYNCKV